MRTTLRAVLVIARVTLLEAIRNRILLVALVFTVALVGLSVAAAAVSLGERSRLIVDVGLAATSAVGSLIAVALMIGSFGREIERHTAYPVLARPVSRWSFVLGKYLGVVATMFIVTTLMLAATAAAVIFYGDHVPVAFWPSAVLAWLEMGLVAAVALLFSCYTSPVLAATYSVSLLLAGNLAGDIRILADTLTEKSAMAAYALRGAFAVLPDLQTLSLRTQAANDLPVPPVFMMHATIYAVAYGATALVLAMILFTRRKAI